MKSIAIFALLAAASGACPAADFTALSVDNEFDVERMPFGSGTPATGATTGTQPAYHVVDGLYHVPNYLPGFPTAATIWPREVPIECEPDPVTGKPACTGYRIQPAMERGEYVFIRPVAKVIPPVPVVNVQDCKCEYAQPPQKPLPVTRKKPLG
ncbi:MAG: hypothetical protein JWQ21_752 [Herminiimonas sp.]|nr:hypothetical protein [Herminiimonas sp.]